MHWETTARSGFINPPFWCCFSLARFIHESRAIPEAGTKWEVQAHLLEDDGSTKGVWHEYTCEVVLSADLIAQAIDAAQRYAMAPHPLGWVTTWKNISLIIGDREEDKKGFRTEEDDMEELCFVLQEMYDSLSETPVSAGILRYFIGWNVHIPNGKSKTFYHGLSHGFRVSHDISQLLMRIYSGSREVFLLQQLFEYLAARSAEAFYDERIDLPIISPFEDTRTLPEHIVKGIVPPFEIQVQDIEILAAKVDQELIGKVGPLFARASRGPGEPAPMIEPGYSTSFYEGVIHAMALSERIMAIYEGNILPMREPKVLELEAGSHRGCCMAARHGMQAMHGTVN